MIIKAVVNTDLNERTERPSVNSPNYSYYKKGTEITIVDIVNGDPIEGNKVWYKLDNGKYVWSGGVEGMNSIIAETNDDMPVEDIEEDVTYNYKEYIRNLPENWINADCSNVKIGLIDTGIYQKHNALDIDSANALRVHDIDVTDIKGHGTHLAGLIKGNSNVTIMGLCADSIVFSINAFESGIGFIPENIAQAINIAINKECDIINLSLKLYQDQHRDVIDQLNKAINNNIIIVAAAGNDDDLINDINFPAKVRNVISVGSINANQANALKNKQLLCNYVFPNFNLWSTDLPAHNYYKARSGSSVSAAVLTGIICRVIAANKITRSASRLNDVKTIMDAQFKELKHFNYLSYEPYKNND